MNIRKLIPNKISRTAGTTSLKLQKNSPHILFGVGIVGIVGGAVLACRGTLKLEATLEEMRHDVSAVKRDMSEPTLRHSSNEYSERDYQRDVAYAYVRGTASIARLYAPGVIVGGLGVAAVTGSHVQLTRRNNSLALAYAAVHKAYSEYRIRVQEELGEEKELDIYHAANVEKVAGADGKKEEVRIADPNKFSAYARFFDEASPEWKKDPELNRLFVQCQQNYLNNLLHARGHVFLNEAYDALGIDRSSAGQVVGWVLGEEGDNYIDFGIFEAFNSRFVNGYERSILLDFNVDGVVYDKIG